ncbi:hypothetical protein AB0A76_25045 [Streptomyces exfoliatus]|uniref:Uncharacterized protein n=1 Tax=Streptomyces exfoliatus TaxID=1905 RepID=A0ABV3D1W1_STREX
MYDENSENDTGAPRRYAPGQLRLQLPHQSAPVDRGRPPEGSGATGGVAAGMFPDWITPGVISQIIPF